MAKVNIDSKPGKPGLRKRPKLKRGEMRPVFESLLTPSIPNPLDSFEYPGTLEGDATEEVSEILQTILEERQQLRDKFRLRADREYFVCICFQSKEQKEDFLRQMGWLSWGDRYLDGLRCAEALGFDLEPVMLPQVKVELKTPKKLRKEVLADAVASRSHR